MENVLRISESTDESADLVAASDSRLVERALAGNDRAFEILMQRYTPLVIGYLQSELRSVEAQEDLFQEVFLSAYRNLAGLRERDRFGPWLRSIARNALLGRCRKRKVPVEDLSGIEGVAEESANPMESALQAEVAELVVETIAGIGGKYSEILYLRLVAEKTPREIAADLGMEEATVRVRLMRGLRKLRKTLGGKGLYPFDVT